MGGAGRVCVCVCCPHAGRACAGTRSAAAVERQLQPPLHPHPPHPHSHSTAPAPPHTYLGDGLQQWPPHVAQHVAHVRLVRPQPLGRSQAGAAKHLWQRLRRRGYREREGGLYRRGGEGGRSGRDAARRPSDAPGAGPGARRPPRQTRRRGASCGAPRHHPSTARTTHTRAHLGGRGADLLVEVKLEQGHHDLGDLRPGR